MPKYFRAFLGILIWTSLSRREKLCLAGTWSSFPARRSEPQSG